MTVYNPKGDSCLSIWADVYETGALTFPPEARVLEIGCAEADWQTSMLALRPDLRITGIDWRGCKRPGATVKGDVLAFDFPEASFDVVVGISSIEHIGLGHYERDPADVDGDIHCLQRVARWLKPGGWAYLDVPFNPAGYFVDGTSHRVYDSPAALARLIPEGLVFVQHWFADRAGRLVPEAGTLPVKPLPHYDYIALCLRKL